jgi:hypothetical protein
MVWTGPDSRGRLAKSLVTLYEQINRDFPNRKTSEDGSIGNAAHEKTRSDHNVKNTSTPGFCRAIDITHDPLHGVDTYAIAEYLRTHPDPRVRLIISDSRIAGNASYVKDNGGKVWTWSRYRGTNAHDRHIHISVEKIAKLYDDASLWDYGQAGMVPQNSDHAAEVAADDELRMQMARKIIDWEARRDSAGHLAVYQLPSNDGGGTYEVAGINERYDPVALKKIVALLNAKKWQEAEDEAARYIVSNTDAAASWTNDLGVEFYLRDCIFNRGARGAARILQRAVGVTDDGIIGPITKRAILKFTPGDLLLKLRAARENYERNVVGYRANFWAGLVNRWNAQLMTAQEFA